MKKEGDALAPGGGMLNGCLTVQQLHVESLPTETPDTNIIRGPVTGPTTDLYSSKFKSQLG